MAFNSDRGMIRITDAHKIISLIQSGNSFRKSSKEIIFDSTSFAPSIIPIRSIISDVLLRFPSQSNPYYTNLARSEEHTSELQSRFDLVCRLLLEKTK